PAAPLSSSHFLQAVLTTQIYSQRGTVVGLASFWRSQIVQASQVIRSHPDKGVDMDLDGSVVLVTGATGGLGREFVQQFLDRGAVKVYAGTRRDHDWGDPRVVPLRLDVTDPDQIAAAGAAAADVTVLVNNAGVNGAESLLTSSEEDIRKTYEAHVFGPLR